MLPEEQEGCKRRSRGTKDQLFINKAVIRNCNWRKTNLLMSWIDFRKAYELVPHSWILESLRIIGAADNIIIIIIIKWRISRISSNQTRNISGGFIIATSFCDITLFP